MTLEDRIKATLGDLLFQVIVASSTIEEKERLLADAAKKQKPVPNEE